MTKGTTMVTNNVFRSTRLFREGSSNMVLFSLQHGALRLLSCDLQRHISKINNTNKNNAYKEMHNAQMHDNDASNA